nr:hypothetical protein [Streptomyces sp. SID4937]
MTPTDVTTCEACWISPVDCVRYVPPSDDTDGQASNVVRRDLLCWPCAESGYPVRVAVFPPFGIYGLTLELRSPVRRRAL